MKKLWHTVTVKEILQKDITAKQVTPLFLEGVA